MVIVPLAFTCFYRGIHSGRLVTFPWAPALINITSACMALSNRHHLLHQYIICKHPNRRSGAFPSWPWHFFVAPVIDSLSLLWRLFSFVMIIAENFNCHSWSYIDGCRLPPPPPPHHIGSTNSLFFPNEPVPFSLSKHLLRDSQFFLIPLHT